MPKPATIEKRNNSKKVLRLTGQLLDDDTFLNAVDEMEASDDAADQAGHNPAGYFMAKGVKIPAGLEIVEAGSESPFYCRFRGFGVSFTISW